LLVFSKQDAAALFSELGFDEPSKSNHAPPPAGSCGCSLENDWCTHQCVSADCTVLTWGCGTFGLYACNGICYVPPGSDAPPSTSTPTPTPTPRPTPRT